MRETWTIWNQKRLALKSPACNIQSACSDSRPHLPDSLQTYGDVLVPDVESCFEDFMCEVACTKSVTCRRNQWKNFLEIRKRAWLPLFYKTMDSISMVSLITCKTDTNLQCFRYGCYIGVKGVSLNKFNFTKISVHSNISVFTWQVTFQGV